MIKTLKRTKPPIVRKDKKSILKKSDEATKPLNKNDGTELANSEFDSISGFSKPLKSSNINDEDESTSPTASKRRLSPPPLKTKTYPTIIDETKGATDLLNESTTSSVVGGVYSPSNAEARRLEAVKELSVSKTSLAIKAGGHKVLPTEDDVKIVKVVILHFIFKYSFFL